MPLSFEHEIIISDDASTDGTWELAQEYASKVPEISAYQCNTDDYNPSIRSERSGWNRCNAYKHATGKYIAHVDGDDFFLDGSDIYKKQIELLELHPECSCCMANDFDLNDGDSLSSAMIRHKERFETGYVLASKEYISKYFRESHVFVYRRNPSINPATLYGGYYVDTIITDHHLQFGDIVCLDDAGYVYVQYKSSIWTEMTSSSEYLAFKHVLYIPLLIPSWKMVFYSSQNHLKQLLRVVWLARSGYTLSEDNKKWVSKFNLYTYKVLCNKIKTRDKIHLELLARYISLLIKWEPSFMLPYKIISLLL
jgi:glycosyltransferase involved in cell wall biosynthesis